jgi:phenylacetate-CoA ligase
MVQIIDILSSYKIQKSTYNFLKKTQNWSEKKLLDYQLKLLANLLTHSYDNVPYYSKIFDEINLKPNDIQSIKDLQKIPFLTRDLVIKNQDNLKAKNYSKNKFELKTTGGTTGNPLNLYIEKGKWLANHLAYNRIFMERAGYNRKNKAVSILGMQKESIYHPIFRTLELSSFYITDKADIYIKKIREFKPKYIISYPSAIGFLSKYINEHKINHIENIKGIFCHGEPLYEWELKFIEEAFNCKVYDIYGHGEKSVIAATCDKSHDYHVFPEYCIVELIDKNGINITKEGEIGELVVTGLHSHIFPFIRYKTGDLGIFTKKKCICERNYPIIKSIIGRINEYLVTKNGELIHLKIINYFISENSLYIKKWQLIQEKKGLLVLSIIKDEKFSKKQMEKIKENFDNKYKAKFELKINEVEKIEQTGSSKHHFLIQKLPVEKIYYKN